MAIIEHNGYTISQAKNNHYIICKDGKFVMHVPCTQKLSEDELRYEIERYIELSRRMFENGQT